MASKRFCDICDQQLTAEDDRPFIRELIIPESDSGPAGKAVAFVAITNEQNHPLTDVCSGCKLKIVTDGTAPTPKTKIATLQPMAAADARVDTQLFRLPEKPPQIPMRAPAHQAEPIRYEPSLKVYDQ